MGPAKPIVKGSQQILFGRVQTTGWRGVCSGCVAQRKALPRQSLDVKCCDARHAPATRKNRRHPRRLGAGFRVLLSSVKKAEVSAERHLVERVTVAANSPQYWTAAMTLLERRHPERWAKIERREITGKGGGKIKIELDAAQKEKLVAALNEEMKTVEMTENDDGIFEPIED